MTRTKTILIAAAILAVEVLVASGLRSLGTPIGRPPALYVPEGPADFGAGPPVITDPVRVEVGDAVS